MRPRSAWRPFLQPWNRPVVVLLVTQLLSGVLISTQFAFFPIFMEEQLGFTAVLVSTTVAMGRLIGVIASLIGGMLCDSLGRKLTLVLGTAGFLFASLVFLVPVPWLVLVLWAIAGFGLALRIPASQSYAIHASDPQRLGRISALYTLSVTAGGALGNPAAGALLDHHGFGVFGLALIGVSLATTGITQLFLPRFKVASDTVPGAWHRLALGYSPLLRRPIVLVLGALRFLPTCYYGMATVFIPLLMNRLAHTKTTVALYLTVSQVAATLAQVLVGWAADRWGRSWPTLIAFGTLIASSLALGASATHLWGFFVFGVLATCAAWSLSVLSTCLVSDATPAEEQGRVLGFLGLVWNAGMVVGSLIGGALVDISTGLPFFVVAALNAPAIPLTLLFTRLQQASSSPRASFRVRSPEVETPNQQC